MDWIQRIENAIDYVEENITEKLIMRKWQKEPILQVFIFKKCLV